VTERDRAANILGAAALAINDRADTVSRPAEVASDSMAAALSAMDQFLDGPTLEQLRGVLGLSHSGAVRLVDRLVESGLAARGRGADGRSRRVTLSARGARIAREMSSARLTSLDALTSGLTAGERRTLTELLGRVLGKVVETKDGGAWTCRLCDLTACGRAKGRCPAANAATRRFGPDATGVHAGR